MSSLADVLKAAEADPARAIFISRRGVERQRDLAISIGQWLTARGFIVILQDAHFKHQDFMLGMHKALASGARVLALMSKEYFASEDCMKEALAGLNKGRLVLLRVDDCEPLGLLSTVAYIDFGPVWRRGNAAEMEKVVLAALDDPLSLKGSH